MSEEAKTSEAAKIEKAPPRRKLGRGLGALLGETQREEPLARSHGRETELDPAVTLAKSGTGGEKTTGDSVSRLSIAEISPNPDQPRTHFDEDALVELAASIAARGVIQPVIVRPMADGRYQIVAGERRWRAAQKAQLHEIPAIVRDLDTREVMAIALIENIQREDLNPVEEARAYQALAEVEELTQAEIAKLVDKSRSHVANMQRLLGLPEAVLDHVAAGKLSMGHARALIGQEDAVELAEQAVAKNLSVRDVEKLVRRAKKGDAPPATPPRPRDATKDADIAAVQSHLEDFLGMAVRINADADPRSGALTIRYRTLDQLDLICQRLTGGAI
ncbi:ParB/RepB/Spo0J family partition protein [Altererythrobacter sp. CAU 1778]